LKSWSTSEHIRVATLALMMGLLGSQYKYHLLSRLETHYTTQLM